MKLHAALGSVFLAIAASSAFADFARIDSQTDFVRHVTGKTLTRPLVELRVTQDGRIEGRGSVWDVTGDWSWRDGYFCRNLFWGGDALGYNCQVVQVTDDRVRFTSDKGAGESAIFSLE